MVENLLVSIGFRYIEEYRFNEKYSSYIYGKNNVCVIVDVGFDIETDESLFFDYSKYCEMQNSFMKKCGRLYRFNLSDDRKDLLETVAKTLCQTYETAVESIESSFAKTHVDNTPTEAIFEKAFLDAFGNEALDCLKKEVPISNPNGGSYFIDFVVETKTGNYAFEENGVTYHHPLLVGKDKYNELLDKQNEMMKLGYKVFRYSTDNLHFEERIVQELKTVLPEKKDFIPKAIFQNQRGLELYEHQTDILRQLDQDRLDNKYTALIVIPTASGKSEICLTDLQKEYVKRDVSRVLILVPTVRVREDWIERIKAIESEYELVDVVTYNSAFIRKNDTAPEYYDYIIFDEAHHAQAPNCKAIIQYYHPKYLIGLTATDERLDKKSLKEIFGNYNVNLTLEEAIKKDVVSNIRAYRLESNINLENVRYDGHDFNSSDLENGVVVESRNELIADTLDKYFKPQEGFYKQGIVFCVNKEHTKKVANLLKQKGLTAEAVYGGNSKNESSFNDYKERKLQFLCSCQLISEGWDSPQTEVVVMARPTLSKVLYQQQIGRGLRKYPGKECLYLIDVVDNYSAKLRPWCFNSLFHVTQYSDFIGVKDNDFDYLSILGLSEHEIAMKEIDILTFEEKYKDYLSLEQAARELYIGTATLNKWNKDKKYASLYLPLGRVEMPYFSSADIEKIRTDRGLTIHSDETILKDFEGFIEENTLTFSFKLIFLIECLKLADQEGNINLDSLSKEYSRFYRTRLENNLPVDKPTCIYTLEKLANNSFVKESILSNPFEKYERKRFFYHSKDLNIISFNNALWTKLDSEKQKEIIEKEMEFLKEYYKERGGLVDGYQF